MTELINQFLNAQTTKEVDEIVWSNIETLNDNPRLYSFARNARKRICNLRRIKIQLTEIIYLN
jgi:hypothetical protein